MSHEILGQRFKSRVHPAWHGLGTTFGADVKVTASEAIAEITQGVEVVKVPVSYELDGVQHQMVKRAAIVRRPTKEDPEIVEFGVASADWQLESYEAVASVFDELSKVHQVETAGLLRDGRTAFLTLRAGEWDVLGDPMEQYMLLNISMEPYISHWVSQNDVRVVCNNTNTMAKRRSMLDVKIPHQRDSLTQMKIAAEVVAAVAEGKEKIKELCTALAKKNLTSVEAEAIFNAAHPIPMPPRKLRALVGITEEERTQYTKNLDPETMAQVALGKVEFERALTRRENLVEVVRERYAEFDVQNLRGTAWAAYNAVTEVADWREGRGADASAVFGARAMEKARAFEAAAVLVS